MPGAGAGAGQSQPVPKVPGTGCRYEVRGCRRRCRSQSTGTKSAGCRCRFEVPGAGPAPGTSKTGTKSAGCRVPVCGAGCRCRVSVFTLTGTGTGTLINHTQRPEISKFYFFETFHVQVIPWHLKFHPHICNIRRKLNWNTVMKFVYKSSKSFK